MFKVLVGDHDNVNFVAVLDYLTNEKIGVLHADNATQVLEKYKKTNPDVLVLNSNLPLSNGNELLIKLSEIDSKKNVIIIEPYSQNRNRINELNKVYKIISSSVDPSIIADITKDLLNSLRASSPLFKAEAIINQIKFNRYSRGYTYIIEALKLLTKYPNHFLKIQDLYKQLSKELNVPANQIGWAIEKALDVAYRNSEKGTFESVLRGYEPNRKPSPKYFFCVLWENVV